MPKPSLDDVVVLLPGILGSVLRREGKIVWGYSPKTLATALLTGGESLRDALFLDHDSGDWEEDPGDIEATHLMPDLHLLPSLWKIDGYSGIENFLGERFDLKGGDDYFSFPYDWRRDNRINARRLKRSVEGWLREKRRSRPNAKLIFLAHSMGGLVARYYLEVLGGWRETRALVTFGTPFAGSVNALDALSGGVRKGPLHLSALTEMARSFPSVYQLLPTYKVLDLGDGELKRLGESEGLPNLCPRRLNDAVGFHREDSRGRGKPRGTGLRSIPRGRPRSAHLPVGSLARNRAGDASNARWQRFQWRWNGAASVGGFAGGSETGHFCRDPTRGATECRRCAQSRGGFDERI